MRPLQRQQGSSFRSRKSRRRFARKKRGVSDVVATIILLALTVTLFASIFAFVTTFPSPPAQSSNQFQAKLIVTANGTYVSGIQIMHLAGPSVSTSAQIYLKSAVHPGACPFTSSYPVSSDPTNITGSVWTLGETWSVPFSALCPSPSGPHLDQLPDNITVYVVNNNNLLFHVILPGTQIVTPPQILSAWIAPSPVAVRTTFSVEATITGSIVPGSVFVNLANVPGLPTTPQPMELYHGVWIWNSTTNSSTGPTKAGSYSGFINVSGPKGAAVFGTVPIPVTESSGGIVVSISAVPSSGQVPLHVAFAASVSGANGSITYAWSFGDLKGNTSTTANPTDWYNTSGTYLVSLTVTDSKGNQGSATQIITATYPFNAGSQASAAPSCYYNRYYGWRCTATVYWEAWDNGSQPISVSGVEYLNDTTTNSNVQSWSIPATNVPASHGSTGLKTQSGTPQVNYNDHFEVTLVLTATISGQFAGTITSTYLFTAS